MGKFIISSALLELSAGLASIILFFALSIGIAMAARGVHKLINKHER